MRRLIQQEGAVYINIRELGAELMVMRDKFEAARPEGLEGYKTVGQMEAIAAMQEYLVACLDAVKK